MKSLKFWRYKINLFATIFNCFSMHNVVVLSNKLVSRHQLMGCYPKKHSPKNVAIATVIGAEELGSSFVETKEHFCVLKSSVNVYYATVVLRTQPGEDPSRQEVVVCS
ncbi:hypothetical protein C0J52_24711 [Blattella germanica]|nr:hypothetical protein C0J52_24711 [Blattella germanica]